GLPAGTRTGSQGTTKATLTLLGDLPVVLDARRRGPEDEAVLPVEIRIEHDDEGVLILEIGIATHFAVHDPRGIRIVEAGADVGRLLVEADVRLGAFGSRAAVEGLVLHEVADDGSAGPDRIVEPAVQLGSGLDLHGLGDGAGRAGTRDLSRRGLGS